MNAQIARLRRHLRSPLYRNGYALIFSSAVTSGLGFIYWVWAAQTYDTETVGLNSALLSTIVFLANVGQLNLGNALNRFLPSAGTGTPRFLLGTYLVTLIMACIASVLFILGVNTWAPRLSFLSSNPLLGAGFVLAVAAWVMFVLQDSALVGLRQATWVPVENTLFAIAKIVLLALLVLPLPTYGIIASWMIPVMVSILPVNYLIFRYLIPRHIEQTRDRAVLIPRSHIARFVTGDYVGSLISAATIDLLPLIIIERVTPSANAYYFLSWTIAYTLYLFSRNMGMSLIAEGAIAPEKLNTYSYRALVQTARLLVPLIVVAVLGAPVILQLFGSKYAEQAPDLLRLLCLSALPNLIVSMFLSIARVRRQVKAIVLVQAGMCVLVLSQTFLLLESYGITGVGIAWLSSQTILAIILGVTQLRPAWLHNVKLPDIVRLLTVPRRAWRAWTRRNDLPQARRILPAILHKMQSAASNDSAPGWQVQRLLPTLNDVSVITLGAVGQAPTAVLKLPRSAVATATLKRQIDMLQDLYLDDRLEEWRSYLPQLLTTGNVGRQFFSVEQIVGGERADALLEAPDTRIIAQTTALAWLETFHLRTSGLQRVDAEMLQRWIGEPLRTVRDWNARRRNPRQRVPAINRLEAELHKALGGRTVTVSRTHGDFTPGNILMADGGRHITGVLDWELSRQADLPLLDVIQFLLAGRMLTHKRELGDIMRDLLGTTSWTDEERQLLARAQAALPGDTLDSRAMLLLAWLRHVSDNLNKSAHYASHWLWTVKNVDGVLACI